MLVATSHSPTPIFDHEKCLQTLGEHSCPAENHCYRGKHKDLLQTEILILGSSGWRLGIEGASTQQGVTALGADTENTPKMLPPGKRGLAFPLGGSNSSNP